MEDGGFDAHGIGTHPRDAPSNHGAVCERVLDVLQAEGFIRGYSVAEMRQGISEITIELKYQEGTPVIREIQRVSRPGRRVYSKIRDLRQVYGGLGIAILSTPKGVLSDNVARAENVGGEVLCHVF